MKKIQTLKKTFIASLLFGAFFGSSILMAFPDDICTTNCEEDLGGPYFGPAYYACVSTCGGTCSPAGVCSTHMR